MPYTPIHCLAVLPLRKNHLLNFPALLIGAMSPDFEHVIRLEPTSLHSHHWFAPFWFCLPLGFLAMAIYKQFWEPLICENNSIENPWSLTFCFSIAISLLIGAYTHIFWDSFTHVGRLGSFLFPFLENKVELFGFLFSSICNFLQHLSNALGLILVLILYRKFLFQKSMLPFLFFGSFLFSLAMAIAYLDAQGIFSKSFVVLTGHWFYIIFLWVVTLLGIINQFKPLK